MSSHPAVTIEGVKALSAALDKISKITLLETDVSANTTGLLLAKRIAQKALDEVFPRA